MPATYVLFDTKASISNFMFDAMSFSVVFKILSIPK